jgi:hypothetical protein
MKSLQAYWVTLLSAGLLGLLLSPPIRELFLTRMSLHMNLQLPLFVLCGMGLIAPWRVFLTQLFSPVNQFGLTGLLSAMGLFGIWMVPRALDAAVIYLSIDLLKVASLLLTGIFLAISWRPAGAVLQAFFIGNMIWMSLTVGILVADSPSRLCNAYLIEDQRVAGYGLIAFSICAGLLWLLNLRYTNISLGKRSNISS